jgi:hypothetical protein
MSKIQPGGGYGFTSTGYGFSINTNQPFDLTPSSDGPLTPFLNVNKVTITPGTVNRYVPTISSVYLDATTPPEITVSAEGYILVSVSYEVNKFFPRTAEIVFNAGATVPADTNTVGYYPLAKINSASGAFSLVRLSDKGNLVVNRLKAGASTAVWWWDLIS